MIENIRYKDYKIYFNEDSKEYIPLGKKVVDKDIEIFNEFKVTKRNYVAGISHNGRRYILKSPRNEHRIPQRKIQTFFKEGEALTTLKNLNYLREKEGFLEFPKVVLAIVKRKNNLIVDSYMVMEYVEGDRPKKEDIDKIVDFGRKLHSRGYYHGDFNTSNFTVVEGDIKTFDTQGKKMLTPYRKHYDTLTFQRDLLVLEYGLNGVKLFGYRKDIFYILANFIKNFKNTKVVSYIKKVKKNLRNKGWKV